MVEEIIKMAVSNGIWAVLFVSLLIFQLKNSEQREKKYQETISSLNSSLECVHSIANDVTELKKCVLKVSKKEKNKTQDTKNEKPF